MTDQNYNLRHDYELLRDDKTTMELEDFLNGN